MTPKTFLTALTMFFLFTITAAAQQSGATGTYAKSSTKEARPRLWAFTGLEGYWTGSMEFADPVTRERHKISLTVEAHLVMSAKHLSMHFIYREPDGLVEQNDLYMYDEQQDMLARLSLTDGTEYRYEYAVEGFDEVRGASDWILKLKRRGYEDDALLEYRHTMRLRHNDLTISVESKNPDGDYEFRSETTLSRTMRPTPVHFVLLGHEGASNVSLSGDFNNWSADARPMLFEGGAWKTLLPLPAGTWRYQFVVDGRRLFDPNNDRSEHSGKGGRKSIIVVE